MHLDPLHAPGLDPHSYARPGEVFVRHLGLDLTVDFDAHVLTGAATLALVRTPGAGEVVLDTRDLEILDITVASAGDLDRLPPLAALERPWRPTTWRLGGAHPLLGRPLVVTLPDETIDLDKFIGVKGVKAIGNRLSPFKVKELELLDAVFIPMTPELEERQQMLITDDEVGNLEAPDEEDLEDWPMARL